MIQSFDSQEDIDESFENVMDSAQDIAHLEERLTLLDYEIEEHEDDIRILRREQDDLEKELQDLQEQR